MKYLAIFFLLLLTLPGARAQQFKVSYTAAAYAGPFTGNVILYLSQKNEAPKNQPSWPCFRLAVRNVPPGQAITFDDAALSYPTLLSRIARGDYYVQAVWDRNLEGRAIGQSTGNPYSPSRKVRLGAASETFVLVCDQAVAAPVFVPTTFCQEIKVPSALLTRFQRKPVSLNAAVILPRDYHQHPGRRYPLVLTVGGYGGSYLHYSRTESTDTLPANPIDTIACVRVFLDGDCSLGHSVYANSDNNGPVGDAFTTEFLPALERRYRTNGARLLRGHSSGGWAVVYLLTHYPKLFAGGNASAPDPVDFHRFLRTNLYTDARWVPVPDSVIYGGPLPAPAVYDRPNIAHHLENVLYRGEQDVSFDAVFGPRGPQGLPKPLFDPATGTLDRQVFAYWKRYDLTQYITRHWARLKPDLNGKLRVSAGTEDNYFLNFSAMLMEQQMKKLGADVVFAYYPGTHFTVSTPEYRKAEIQWLKKTYLQWLAQHPQA
ncbi:alpha/beta hydrolase-fold protein [Hymenobacter convexus]|uniref:alpha/beta hydrolase-fold protein n=1 Tax=Hymenobacter sp. CA1UV-4 TaxID=3063782 RepID=UPI0027123E30|nr:alpha/beta hydrolase-fold protein [Hymenobacter sp. CA1UV-4]MDO7851158.1 alpha/beta hydrolase-fold protein [Hymenobacter sp. CA1UV-4]